MPIFPFLSPKPKKPYTKRPPKSIKQILHDAWIRELRRNPDLLRRVAAKEAGFLDLLEPPPSDDEGEELLSPEQEMSQIVSQAAIAKIQSSPQLLDKVVSRRLEEMLGDGKSQSPLAELLESAETLEEVRERLGLVSDTRLLTPAVLQAAIQAFAPQIQSIFGGGSNGSSRRVYVVETPEGLQEMDSVAYKAYLERKAGLPAPRQTSALAGQKQLELGPRVTPEDITPEEESHLDPGNHATAPSQQRSGYPTPEYPKSPSQGSSPIAPLGGDVPQYDEPNQPKQYYINLGDWIPYLDKPPYEFAIVLNEATGEEGQQGQIARFTVDMLSSHSADQILALLQGLKATQPELAKYVEMIESKREWLEVLVSQYRIM